MVLRNLEKYTLGQDMLYIMIVEKDTWFAMKSRGSYSLIGCTVAPPFVFSDLEIYSDNINTLPEI